jgi:ABC-2 type transport system permease protein
VPPWLATILQASPTLHFVSLAQAILYRGAGFAVVWRQFVIVALIGGLFWLLLSCASAMSPPPRRDSSPPPAMSA